MGAILGWWAGSAAALLLLMLAVGLAATRHVLGVLIDSRGRYSLTHTQVTTWTIVILSLLSGAFFGRLQHGVAHPLELTIPAELLAVMGISLGSAVLVSAAKAVRNAKASASVAASGPAPNEPKLVQLFLLEEGAYADQAVDLTKLQNFVITLILVIAYIGEATHVILQTQTAADFTTLPGFTGVFLILLGIGNAGHLAGKFISGTGAPGGLTVADRQDAVTLASLNTGATRPGSMWKKASPKAVKPDLGADQPPQRQVYR